MKLLFFDRLKELVLIELLDALGSLKVAVESFVVGHLRLVGFPIEDLLANNQLFVVLLDLVAELGILVLHLVLEDFLGFARDRVHAAVSLLGHLHFLVQVALVRRNRRLLLRLILVNHVLHLILMIALVLLLVLNDLLPLLPFLSVFLLHVGHTLGVQQIHLLNTLLRLLLLFDVQSGPLPFLFLALGFDQLLLFLPALFG